MIIDYNKSLIFFFYLTNFVVLISLDIAYLILLIFLSSQLFFLKLKFSYINKYFRFFYLLFIIFFMGFFFSFSNGYLNILRDVYSFSTPIILLSFGYLLASRLKISEVFYHLMICSTLMVVYQFIDFFIIKGFNFQNNLDQFHSNNLYLIPLSISIILFYNKQANIDFKPYWKLIILTLLFLSLLLLNQRMHYLSFFILILSNLGFFAIQKKLSLKKTFISLSFFIVSILIFFFNGNQLNDKFDSSIQEITNTKFESERDITIYWRAFEVYRALLSFEQSSMINKVFGSGFGKTIDLGGTFALGNVDYNSILRFHNGYIYILTKAGFVGLTAIILFYLKIIKANIIVRRNDLQKNIFIKKIILGMSITLLFTTIVAGGILNGAGMFGFLIIFSFLMKKSDLLNEKAL